MKKSKRAPPLVNCCPLSATSTTDGRARAEEVRGVRHSNAPPPATTEAVTVAARTSAPATRICCHSAVLAAGPTCTSACVLLVASSPLPSSPLPPSPLPPSPLATSAGGGGAIAKRQRRCEPCPSSRPTSCRSVPPTMGPDAGLRELIIGAAYVSNRNVFTLNCCPFKVTSRAADTVPVGKLPGGGGNAAAAAAAEWAAAAAAFCSATAMRTSWL